MCDAEGSRPTTVVCITVTAWGELLAVAGRHRKLEFSLEGKW